jgi:uncharacterized protein YdhG (YjbR/CyaY superfamily)
MDVDQYIRQFPENVREILQNVRNIVLDCAPNAAENISYGMPAYKLNNKPLVYYAAYKKHIGFYATPTGHKAFEKELSRFKKGKGSVQFPLTEAMPYELIAKMIKFRVNENEHK